MNQNMLKLNDDKTEHIVFTSKYKPDLYNDLSITLWWTVIHKSGTWGSYLIECYRYISMCLITGKNVRFHLRNISRIKETSVVLIKLLVMS